MFILFGAQCLNVDCSDLAGISTEGGVVLSWGVSMASKKSQSRSIQIAAAERAKRAAEGRRNTREKNILAGLGEPPKPILNAGVIGEEMEKKIEEYRQKLNERNARDIRQTSDLPRLRTVKESILMMIRTFTANGRIRKLPADLEKLRRGELHPYLPRFDWRDCNVVPAVRDQKDSSLCWAITATQVYESGLMIQRANFAINSSSVAPNVFRIDKVELNTRSTFECMNTKDPDSLLAGGRYEAALNFYTLKGISPNSIKLLTGAPVTYLPGLDLHIEERLAAELGSSFRKSQKVVLLNGKEAPLSATVRDGELPEKHCKDGTRKVKIIGWDYVKQKNQWNIPRRKELKKALLKHGPIAVAMNQNGFTEYGEQKIDDHCLEVGRNSKTGMVFKKDPLSQDLFVRIPRRAFGTLLKERVYETGVESLCPDTFVNLNSTWEELRSQDFGPATHNVYELLGAASDCIRKGRHFRQASEDRDVGLFYDKDTSEFIWRFPSSNEALLKKVAGEWTICLPANTETRLARNRDGVTVTIPHGKEFEDLDPVFRGNPKAKANHEVMLVGWDDRKRAWIVQNSWGEGWGFRCYAHRQELSRGSRGFAYIAYETFGQFAAWLEAPLVEQKLWDSDSSN